MEKTGEILRGRADAVAELGRISPELKTRIRATEAGVAALPDVLGRGLGVFNPFMEEGARLLATETILDFAEREDIDVLRQLMCDYGDDVLGKIAGAYISSVLEAYCDDDRNDLETVVGVANSTCMIDYIEVKRK